MEAYPDPYFSSESKICGKDNSKEFQLKKRNVEKEAATLATHLKSGTSLDHHTYSWVPKKSSFAVAFVLLSVFGRAALVSFLVIHFLAK